MTITSGACLPTQTPPETNLLAMTGIRVPLSARSAVALNAASLDALLWLTRDRVVAQRCRSELVQ